MSYLVLLEWLGVDNNIGEVTVTTEDQVGPSTWGTFCRFALELMEPTFEDTMFLLGNFDTCCRNGSGMLLWSLGSTPLGASANRISSCGIRIRPCLMLERIAKLQI